MAISAAIESACTAGGSGACTRAFSPGRRVPVLDGAHLWTDAADGRLPLYLAWHPGTGDCLLCLDTAQAARWGYGPTRRLGFVEAVSTDRLGDQGRSRPWCSREGGA